MTKRPWVASVISIFTSKRVAVALVAAVALVVGVMSVGALVLVQKKITEIADVKGAPYTPPRYPGDRHTVQTPAVASANTDASGQSPAKSRKSASASAQTPAAPPQHPAPAAPISPIKNVVTPPPGGLLPPVTLPNVPPSGPSPNAPNPGASPQSPQLLKPLTDPLADLLSLQVHLQTPLAGLRLGL